jgi:excisionase family DNA binding protein
MPALLSAAQVAQIFGRSKRTIRNWVRAGHLHPVRLGRSVFFRADDIHALLEAR